MREIIYIALAGGLGALGRFYLCSLAHRLLGQGFPFGTLIVNILGSFLIGLIMELGITSDLVPPAWRTALTIGFLGAFTTFSAFSYETLGYIESGNWFMVGVNISANVFPAIIAVFLGVWAGRTIIGA